MGRLLHHRIKLVDLSLLVVTNSEGLRGVCRVCMHVLRLKNSALVKKSKPWLLDDL